MRPGRGHGSAFHPPVFTKWSLPGTAGSGHGEEQSAAPVAEFPVEDAVIGAGGADVALDLSSADPQEMDDFPMDAFIFPEEASDFPATSRNPAATVAPVLEVTVSAEPAFGAEPAAGADRSQELAGRLERMAHRLRSGGTGALGSAMAEGDRFDALLAGLLAGYLAARHD